MLREYRLTNFKAFGETVTIPIRPLTLIFGANSSGKSSIFQPLLLLKQTLEEAKNPNTALLPKGSLVDLGTYRDFVHRHETERDFGVGARFDLERADAERADALPESVQKIVESDKGNLLPELAQKIVESASVTKAGLTVQFSSDEEGDAATPRNVDLAVGDQKQAVISYLSYRHYLSRLALEEFAALTDKFIALSKEWIALKEEDKDAEANNIKTRIGEVQKQLEKQGEIYERDLDLEEVTIKPESEFWRYWWRCTKSYIREKLDHEAVWLYGSKEGEGNTDEKDDFFEKLENYPFEEAIRNLGNALRSSTADYQNFLPKGHDITRVACPFQVSYFYSLHPKDEYIDGLDISPFTRHVCSTFYRLLEDLVYLGPLRRHPERHYEFSGDTIDYVGQSGEYLPSILFQRPELVEQINKDLKRLKVKYQLKVSKLQYEEGPSPSNVFSLRLIDKPADEKRDEKNEIDASLRDVGFGISQVLPIVVQSRLSEKKTLLIEQPEIHLHPAHQAELGDLFIRSAKERDNTLLLETHSENLILRILRRIRQTTSKDSALPEGCEIRPEDIAVLYVEPGEKGAQVIEIPVTEDGDFDRPWPQGFFEESMKELF